MFRDMVKKLMLQDDYLKNKLVSYVWYVWDIKGLKVIEIKVV